MNHISPTQMMAFVEEVHEIEKAAQISAITGAARRYAGRATDWMRRFGKRQLYGLTGHGVKDIGEARRLGLVGKVHMPAGPASAREWKAYEKALKKVKLEEEAFRKGRLSLPGAVHGLATDPVGTLRSGWQRGGLVGKGFAGLGAYETGKAALTPTEPGGPGKARRMLGAAGSTVGWMVAPPTLLAGMMMGSGGERVGKAVGGAADTAAGAVRARAARPGAVAPGPAAPPAPPAERPGVLQRALTAPGGGGRRALRRHLIQGVAQAAGGPEGIR